MLKIKEYLIPIEQISYIKFDKVYEIIRIYLKNNNYEINIKECSKKDFDDLVEKVKE